MDSEQIHNDSINAAYLNVCRFQYNLLYQVRCSAYRCMRMQTTNPLEVWLKYKYASDSDANVETDVIADFDEDG
jgi:hypothetical protein